MKELTSKLLEAIKVLRESGITNIPPIYIDNHNKIYDEKEFDYVIEASAPPKAIKAFLACKGAKIVLADKIYERV